MHRLACVLYRHSPESYDVLRAILPLPDGRNIQRHFADEVTERRQQLTDLERLAQLVISHCEQHGQEPQGQQVLLAIDVTGISDTGVAGTAG
jgi:hypothetical protein